MIGKGTMKKDESHAKLGRRVPQSDEFPFGWQQIDTLPPDQPCVVALSGSSADDSKKANGFAKMIQGFMEDKDFPIYSVEYDLTGRNFRVDREAVLARYGQENPDLPFINLVKEEDKTYVPQYIRELYQKIIAPRLRDENGNRLPIQKAAQRLNMLVFTNHCHGSTVMLQMQHLMGEDMKKLGYPPKVQDYLYKQVHSVDVAPVTPIGVGKFTTYKFASFADDRVTTVHTPKVEHILKRKKEHERFLKNIGTPKAREAKNKPFMMNFSLFRPTVNEIIFAVNNMYPLEIQKDKKFEGIEHSFDSYSDKIDDNRTKQGDQLSIMFHSVVNWLVKNAKKNSNELSELPNIFEEQQFKEPLARAMNNRYDFITKEAKLEKSRQIKNKKTSSSR